MEKNKFLEGVNDWNNHLFLLWEALEATTGDVVEMGCGDGSTRQLHEYCKDNNRVLYSFETESKYMDEFIYLESPNHKFFSINNDWDKVKDICPNPSVILIDHAPGERRIVDVKRFCDSAEILVCHDTQPPPTAADYGWEQIWHLFKFKIDLEVDMNYECAPPDNRTWASAISNTIDVTKWIGIDTGRSDYRIVKNDR